jgi:hypothetical protein
MNTKIIMTASALFLGASGIIFTFMPVETLAYLGLEARMNSRIFVQLLGALYFAFAMLNWMTRASIIGGIYNRPVAVANFTHFLMASIALVKGLMSDRDLPVLIWVVAIIYSILAITFGVLLFRHPVKQE